MPAPTREELILNLKSNPKTKGMTDAQIAAKADEILPKLVEKYGGEATVKETVKVAPKAPPKSATPAPKAPAPKPAPSAKPMAAPMYASPAEVPMMMEETRIYPPSSSARDMLAPEPVPMLGKPAIPSYVTRYGGMGDVRKDEDEIAGMRAAMKAMKPAKAALVDAMDDADVAAAYKRLNAE